MEQGWISFRTFSLWKPLGEMIVVWGISNVPLLFLFFGKLISVEGAVPSWHLFESTIRESFEEGEIIIYMCVVLAPVLWIMLSEWKGRKHYTFFMWLLVAQLLAIGFTGVLYTLHKIGVELNQEFVPGFAKATYIGVMVLWLGTLWYKNVFLDASKSIPVSPTYNSLREKLEERDND